MTYIFKVMYPIIIGLYSVSFITGGGYSNEFKDWFCDGTAALHVCMCTVAMQAGKSRVLS